jgi:NADH:ubiquinone oxidoreductase subunit 5 (subunit L)/multisubunit Na+/H+ antiporter MnhA subunit
MLYLGWEGVGLASLPADLFLVPQAQRGDGGMKAFLMNRVGDAGLRDRRSSACSPTSGTVDYAGRASTCPQAQGKRRVPGAFALLLLLGAGR